MWKKISILLEMIKFKHTVFAMPFALMGAFLAKRGAPDVTVFFWVVMAMVGARTSAMTFNRIADRRFDAANPRTTGRALPAGEVTLMQSWLLMLVASALFFFACFMLNPLALKIAPFALGLTLFYSLTKRFTWLCHYVLGLALSIAPIGAYIVLSGSFGLPPILLSVAVFFWVGGFDILYSLQDEEFDRQERLHSIPQQFGRKKALIISAVSHLFTLGSLVVFGIIMASSWMYWIGFSLFSALLIREHLIVKPNDISRVNQAFATLNATASIIFAVFSLLDLFQYYFIP